MLDWILNPTHVIAILVILAIGTPLLMAIPHVRKLPRRQALVLVLSGPLILVMWFAYNSIMDALGLDSILAMAINGVLFVFVGFVLGLYMSRGK